MNSCEIIPNDHGISVATMCELRWGNTKNNFGAGFGLLAIKFLDLFGTFSPSRVSLGSVDDFQQIFANKECLHINFPFKIISVSEFIELIFSGHDDDMVIRLL